MTSLLRHWFLCISNYNFSLIYAFNVITALFITFQNKKILFSKNHRSSHIVAKIPKCDDHLRRPATSHWLPFATVLFMRRRATSHLFLIATRKILWHYSLLNTKHAYLIIVYCQSSLIMLNIFVEYSNCDIRMVYHVKKFYDVDFRCGCVHDLLIWFTAYSF